MIPKKNLVRPSTKKTINGRVRVRTLPGPGGNPQGKGRGKRVRRPKRRPPQEKVRKRKIPIIKS